MTYTFGTDFISVTDEVRRLARKVVLGDFTEDEIKSYQFKVYSLIRTLSDKDDWDTGDREYGALQLYETEIAAMLIRQHYGNSTQSADAEASIAKLIGTLSTFIGDIDTPIEGATSRIRRTEFKSWNLNTAIPIPRSGLTIT